MQIVRKLSLSTIKGSLIKMKMKYFCFLLVFCLTYQHLAGQEIDLLLKGGTVIDPKNGINRIMDVAIDDGKIVRVAQNIPETGIFRVVDVRGLYVVPGLIDIHSHNFYGTEPDSYLSNGFTAVAPDPLTFRTGVTTVVDVGGAGWRSFETFKRQTIDNSKTRVLSMLNIVGIGMKGGAFEQSLGDMNAEHTARVAKQYPQYIVGVKVAHYAGPDWTPVERAVEAGKLANIPVMIDFGGYKAQPLSIQTLFFEKLRPGDIFTHTYAHVEGRIPIVDEQRKVRPFVFDAQKRGIIFDVGHGGGSFVWNQAVPALEQGFKPNTISTDLHTGSMNGGMKEQINVMSKFLNLGMTVQEVVTCSTWNPAQVIKRPELGHLSVGAEADVAVLRLHEGSFGFIDTRGWTYPGKYKLEVELTLRAGEVVWDLNGITRPRWER